MDLGNITFLGLIGLGVVNVITFFNADLDSRIKFILSAIIVFAATYIPAELGNVLLDKIKIALEIAFASSGAYKLAVKAGGN